MFGAMKSILVLIVCLATLAPPARAQGTATASDSLLRRRTTEVASKFEEFSGRKGALYTRTVERIGQIRAEGFHDIALSIATVTDAGGTGGSSSALLFGEWRSKRSNPGNVGIVDADEVASLVAAVVLMEKRAPELRAAASPTEAVYIARTGLRVIVSGAGPDQRLYLDSPHYWVDMYEFEMADVPKLRALMETAAGKLAAKR
jgi:hypothetical protein